MAPNVKSAAEARAVVDAAKYAPLGKRGVILGGTHTGFRSVSPRGSWTILNQNTTIICQIESREALEDLEAIAATQEWMCCGLVTST